MVLYDLVKDLLSSMYSVMIAEGTQQRCNNHEYREASIVYIAEQCSVYPSLSSEDLHRPPAHLGGGSEVTVVD
jgi:hypothetical protein